MKSGPLAERRKKVRWYMWAASGTTLAGFVVGLCWLFLSGCHSCSEVLPARFERVQEIVENKVAMLAPPGRRPPSGVLWATWYEHRRALRKIVPGERAEYRVSALRFDGGQPADVSCRVIIEQVAAGVRLVCDGASWDASILSFEPEGAHWYAQGFLDDVKDEIPILPQQIRWGQPAGGLRLGVAVEPRRGFMSKYPTLRVFVENASQDNLVVCGRMPNMDAKRTCSNGLHYALELAYVAADGNKSTAMVCGRWRDEAFSAPGRELAPREAALLGRADLRLGDVLAEDGKEGNGALPPGDYDLLITLKTQGIPETPLTGATAKVWQGSVNASAKLPTWHKDNR